MENNEKFNPDDWVYVYDNECPGYVKGNEWIPEHEYNHRCMPALEDIVLPEEQNVIQKTVDKIGEKEVRKTINKYAKPMEEREPTLRDTIAIAAMKKLVIYTIEHQTADQEIAIARRSYAIADAMIKERDK